MFRATTAGVLAVGSLLSCGGSSSPQAPSSSTPSGTLVWQDEFDGQGLPDASRWNNEVGLIRNNERQFYTERRSENARLEGPLTDLVAGLERSLVGPLERRQRRLAELESRR